jgi:hypothetical protein
MLPKRSTVRESLLYEPVLRPPFLLELLRLSPANRTGLLRLIQDAPVVSWKWGVIDAFPFFPGFFENKLLEGWHIRFSGGGED